MFAFRSVAYREQMARHLSRTKLAKLNASARISGTARDVTTADSRGEDTGDAGHRRTLSARAPPLMDGCQIPERRRYAGRVATNV